MRQLHCHPILRASQNRNVYFLITIIAVVCLCSSLCQSSVIWKNTATPLTSNGSKSVTCMLHNPLDYSCYDIFGVPHLGLIPHPSCCNFYIQCVNDESGKPVPKLENCGTDEMFDFLYTCECTTPPNLNACFDQDNLEHEMDRFRCSDLDAASDGSKLHKN